MILLDASTIIDGLRGKDLQLLGRMSVVGGAVCGVTRAEVLTGARSSADRARLVTILNGFQQVAIADSMWDEIGDLQFALRSSGVTAPLADAILATLAMTLDVEIWARDTHFQHMQRVIPALKLYQEIP